ncbi:condensin complex subunit 3 isoform X2 [Zootermopsis nevadensis]|uniref:condensin complex subunit 3 isoform X2 n=1 Tax=Zootermopsis nevadensis TaxID=136037 RepID=UPI000B8EADEC|nr:condensin complex subunit 3 isoform X2 [Zootermopsis nevadensis]
MWYGTERSVTATESIQNHGENLVFLTLSVFQEPLERFFKNYVNCLGSLFLIGEKHTTVERTLEFAAKFCVSLYDGQVNNEDTLSENDEMPPFLTLLFDYLLKLHKTRNQNIRFRVCQFINKLLSSLGEEASLDDDLCNRICTNMLERLRDKVAAVRAQAVMALQRLQDPTNHKCPVIKAYLFHLEADPSAAVRRSVLNCIGRTNITLPLILERTRDIKDTVRRHAYVVLVKLSIRSLTIKQRERLLREGLKDRSELVRSFVATALLPGWLRNMKGDYLELLHALDVENSTETSILALNTLFKHQPLTEVKGSLLPYQEDKVIPLEKLTPENALFWRCLAQYLHRQGEEMVEELDSVIPNLTPFCQYIRRYYLSEGPKNDEDSWSQIQRQFIVLQLLELSEVFDLADEMGRSNLKKLIYDMLTCTHVKKDLVKILVRVLVGVDPNVNSRLHFLAEIVSEVHEPMTEVSVDLPADEIRKKQLMQAKVRVQLNEVVEEQQEAVQHQDFMQAQVLLEKMKELQEELQRLNVEPSVVHEQVREQHNDRATLSKCLCIIYEMMQSETVTVLTPHLRTIMENFVLHYIEDSDTYIRSLALQTVGTFCFFDQDLAKKFILVFCFQLANGENDEVCTISLKVIFDLFLLYGLQPFQIEDDVDDDNDKTGRKKLFDATDLEDAGEDDITTSKNTDLLPVNDASDNFIRILTSLLDSTSAGMRTVAVEGLCKLILNNRIKSPNLVSRLLIMWYNPVTEGDVYLRQMLGEFFTTLAFGNQYGQETLEQAFLPTLRTLFQAPCTSPLVEVDQDSVVRLVLNLTRPNLNKSSVHNNFAIVLCNEVLLDTDPYNIQVLVRALTQLELILDDEIVLQNISTVAEKVAEHVKDKACLRYVRKFQNMLTSSKFSLTTCMTGTVRTTDGSSVLTNVEQQATDSAEGVSCVSKDTLVNPEPIESDSSDSDENLQINTTPSIRSKMVVPETPDNSDSPVSEMSSDTYSSDIAQLDGEVPSQIPSSRPAQMRRSGRLANKNVRENSN